MKPTATVVVVSLVVALLSACNGIHGPNAGPQKETEHTPPSLKTTLESVVKQLKAVHKEDKGKPLGLYPAEIELVFSVSATKQTGEVVDVSVVPIPLSSKFSRGEVTAEGNTVKVVYRSVATLDPDGASKLTEVLNDQQIRGILLNMNGFSKDDIDSLLESLDEMR